MGLKKLWVPVNNCINGHENFKYKFPPNICFFLLSVFVSLYLCCEISCSAFQSVHQSLKKKSSFPKGSCSASTSSSMVKKTSWQPKGSSTSCSASTSSSMVKKTSSPKDSSSSSSVSRNPKLNVDDDPISTIPKTSMGCLSDKDSGKKQINGVQEQRFTCMGSSSSSRPTTTHDQSMASLASINGGDLFGKYPSSMKGLLIQLQDWSEERVLKIWCDDPSLLDEIEPNDIVRVAELKFGSLYLQNILKDYPLYFDKIFNATLDFIYPLMFHPKGTYVLRKLYVLCDSSHLKLIVENILPWPGLLKSAAKSYTGSGTLMKLIEVLSLPTNSINTRLLKSILDTLNPEFLSMMTSKHGSSLFRFFLKDLDSSQNEIVYNSAAIHCIDLATDGSGYASLIALIKNTPNPYQKVLLLKIIDNAAYLSKDPKGNYVIQAALHQYPELDYMICEKLVGTYLCLSTHKYATNVVQKCIISIGMGYPVSELISSKELHLLSQDPVGNYVVQKALIATRLNRRDLYHRIVGEIQPYMEDLQYHPFGKNVVKLMITKGKSS